VFRYSCIAFVLLLLPGCDLVSDVLTPVPFSLHVVPEAMTDTLLEQRCVLLVTVEDEDSESCLAGPVRVLASAEWATVSVEPPAIWPGQVAEVTVIAEREKSSNSQIIVDGDEGRTITATIRGQRWGHEETATVPITITSEEEDLVGPLAAEVRDLFIPWLAENRPELGISADTQWTGTIVTPHILVVTHYLYFSDDWEMHVFWHVMIPPYNWARIELRQRFEETAPSLAFEIPSRTADPLEVNSIEPSETLWR
jgi:hypothetical protein